MKTKNEGLEKKLGGLKGKKLAHLLLTAAHKNIYIRQQDMANFVGKELGVGENDAKEVVRLLQEQGYIRWYSDPDDFFYGYQWTDKAIGMILGYFKK